MFYPSVHDSMERFPHTFVSSSKSRLFPMTMAVYQFFGKNKSYWNYIFADIVLTCIPVIIVYMIGQKYIVGGMTSGAVKE